MKRTKTAAKFTLVLLALAIIFSPVNANAANTVTGAAGIGSEGAGIQAQVAELEAARLGQIRSALLQDYWAQYRTYIQALAAGNPTTSIPYPRWALSSTPTDAKANFRYIADLYLPDLKDQIAEMSKLTGVAQTDFYEIEYVPPATGVVLPAPGHVVIRRLNSETATQGRLRGLLPSVTITNMGAGGVISMRVDPPETYMGGEALNASLVRNNGLTLDPVLAQELASSETGGADMTFLPGSWVTFGKKGTNPGTAQAKGEDISTSYIPTLRFKGRDGNIIGVNMMQMEQAAGDPVSRLFFKRAEVPGGGVDANYISFEDTRGKIIGLEHIYRRDGADGVTGNNLDLAIWAQMNLGGDFMLLSPGDTVGGETNTRNNQIRFGLGNTARIYLDANNRLRIEGNNPLTIQAPTITLDGNLSVTGTSDMQGNVVMRNGLNMSGTNITNVGNISANSANISGTTTTGTLNATNATISNNPTLAGRTGTSASPYNVWVANAAYASNAGLLGGKPEGSLNVAYADTAGTAGFATSAGSATSASTFGGRTPTQWEDWIKAQIGSGSISESGYAYIGDMIIQWGKTIVYRFGQNLSEYELVYVSFPMSFPRRCFVVNITTELYDGSNSEVGDMIFQLWSYSLSSFSMNAQKMSGNAGSLGYRAHFMAIGY